MRRLETWRFSIRPADDVAFSGEDYGALNSSSLPLVIPGGSRTASIDIPIVEDFTAERNELFSVTLTGTDGIETVGSPNVLVSIVDNDDDDGDGMSNSFEDFFGLDTTADDAGEDLDRDGVSNLLEYAVGQDPTQADVACPLEVVDSATADMILSFSKNPLYTNLFYQVEIGNDLDGWTAVSDTPIETIGEFQRCEATLPPLNARRFFRLAVGLAK